MLSIIGIWIAFYALLFSGGLPLAFAWSAQRHARIVWALPLGLAWSVTLLQVIGSHLPITSTVIVFGGATILLWIALLYFKGWGILREIAGDLHTQSWPLLGMLGLGLVSLFPVFMIGYPASLQGTPNNDAYCYITLAQWFTQHLPHEIPEISPGSPWVGYIRAHLTGNMRIGAEYFLAAFSKILNIDPSQAFTIVSAGVTSLFIPVGYLFLGALQYARKVAILGGVFAGAGAMTITLHMNQNFDNLFGLVLWLGAFSAFLLILLKPKDLSLIPAAGLLTSGVIATYSELLPFFIPLSGGLFLAACLRERRVLFPQLLALGGAGILGVIFNLPAANRAFRVLAAHFTNINAGLAGGDVSSPFLTANVGLNLERFLGLSHIFQSGHGVLVGGLGILFALVAIVGELRFGKNRLYWLAMIGIIVGFAAYFSIIKPHGYAQMKFLFYVQSLIMLLLAAGVGTLLLHWKSLWLRSSILGLTVLFLALNFQATAALLRVDPRAGDRVLSENYLELPALHQSLVPDTPVLAAVSGYFEHLWLAYYLRHHSVHFRSSSPDYFQKPSGYFYQEESYRYILMLRDEVVPKRADYHLWHNDKFVLYDTTLQGAEPLVVLSTGFFDLEASGDSHARWMKERGEFKLWLPKDGVISVNFTASPVPGLHNPNIALQLNGKPHKTRTVNGSQLQFSLPPLNQGWHTLEIESLDGVRTPEGSADLREMSIYLSNFNASYI